MAYAWQSIVLRQKRHRGAAASATFQRRAKRRFHTSYTAFHLEAMALESIGQQA